MLCLKLVRGVENADGVRPEVHVLPDQSRFVIGRDPTCDWPINDRQLALSARHCEIVRIEGKHVLRDTSTNGTFINDSRERLPGDHVLRHGDRLRFGSYAVEVTVVPDSLAVTPARAATASPAAPKRGGDPAAMAGADWERAAARVEAAMPDVKTGLTRISKPPSREAMQELLASLPKADASAAPEAPAATAPRPAIGSNDVLARLAGALGVPVEALGTTDPALAAHRVATLLRVTVWALHRQLTEQAQQLNAMGSRTPLTLSRSEAAPLRMAPKGDAAVAALLAAGQGADAMLLMAVKELGQHSQRLLGAFQAAGQRLGEHLSPGTLERTAGGAGDTAHVWKIYSSLWTALGFGVGKGWTDGYAEAAASYLAAAYDDPQWAEKVSAKVAEQATEKAAR